MFTVNDLNITITRGDTASLEITFTGDVPSSGDTVVMAVKKALNDGRPVFEKTGEASEGAITFDIDVEDTAQLAFGTYWWDLRIFYSDGQVTTPFSPRKFIVGEVVTDDR